MVAPLGAGDGGGGGGGKQQEGGGGALHHKSPVINAVAPATLLQRRAANAGDVVIVQICLESNS